MINITKSVSGPILLVFIILGSNSLVQASEKVIVFDVGGVLSKDLEKPVIIDLAKRFSIDVDVLSKAEDQNRYLADMGQLTDQEFWIQTLEDVDVHVTPASFAPEGQVEYLKKFVKCLKGPLAVAKALKEKGYRLAILSNDSLEMSQARRQKCGFDEVFGGENIFISAEIAKNQDDPENFIKPHEGIFHYILSTLIVEAGNVYFIDDNPKNINGANALGIHGIQFKSSEITQPDKKRSAMRKFDEQELTNKLHNLNIDF